MNMDMLEDKDIQKMKEVFPTKEDLKQAFSEHITKEMEVFPIKEDIEDLKQDITGLREQVQALTIKLLKNWE